MSQQAQGKTIIKRFGRKYLVIHATVARVDDKNVVVQLLKRAGKAHFFVTEGKSSPVNKMTFWEALEAYSARQDELGIDPASESVDTELAEITDNLTEEEKASLAQRVEGV